MSDAHTVLIEYIDGARRRLAEFEGPGETTWRDLIEQAMGDAYARVDRSGLAHVVQLLAHLLESQGRFDDALREVDVALPTAAGDDAATAALLALKAAILVGKGDPVAATEFAAAAAALAAELTDEAERLKTLALCATVSLQTFHVRPEAVQELLSRLVAAGRWQDQLFLLSWLIPAQAALGQPAGAAPHIRVMTAISHARRAHFRTADAAAFHDWDVETSAPHAAPLRLKRELRGNPLADWRIRCLEIWRVVGRREWATAPPAVAAIEIAQRRLNGNTGDSGAWARLIAAANGEGGGCRMPAPPIQPVTLTALGAAIADACTAAISGDKNEAHAWLDWVVRARHAGVESSLESPISLRRLHGLLALRAGQPTAARRYLDDAGPWCAASDMHVEAAIATLQSLELKQKLFGKAATGWRLDEEIAAASSALSALGVDPVPHRYVVASAWDAGNNHARAAVLTPRESDVLQRLGEGLSYGEAGKALGIASATVQTVAHRVYDKLGVHRRLDALREARRLGLV